MHHILRSTRRCHSNICRSGGAHQVWLKCWRYITQQSKDSAIQRLKFPYSASLPVSAEYFKDTFCLARSSFHVLPSRRSSSFTPCSRGLTMQGSAHHAAAHYRKGWFIPAVRLDHEQTTKRRQRPRCFQARTPYAAHTSSARHAHAQRPHASFAAPWGAPPAFSDSSPRSSSQRAGALGPVGTFPYVGSAYGRQHHERESMACL